MRLDGATEEAVAQVTGAAAGQVLSAYRQWRIHRLEAAPSPSGADRVALAKLYAAEGDVATAVAHLEQAALDPPLSFPAVSVDPAFRPLATEPRFQRLIGDLWVQ